MLATVRDVMVDEPENVQRIEQIVLIVVELKRSVYVKERLHPIRIVGNECVNRSGILADVASRPRHPIVFEVAPTAFQRASENRAAMPMAPELPSFFYP